MTLPAKQTLLFDLDDTLIHCNKYFAFVVKQFIATMSTWFQPGGLTTPEIQAIQAQFELTSVQHSGFQKEHFPHSFTETYRHFCHVTGRPLCKNETDFLWKLGMSVYEIKVEPYPGMIDTLDCLRDAGHRLFLYTGGETVIQQRKIEQMSLSAYFDNRIFIRQHKTYAALSDIITEHHFHPASTWMIGNSVRTDVVPALRSGLNAIYLKRPKEWSYNVMEIKARPRGAFYTIEQLRDVPRVIQQWCAQKWRHTC